MVLDKEERDRRINAEVKRLASLFKGIEPKRAKTIKNIINRAAFMQVSLEDMEEDINTDGIIEEFTQDHVNFYERERPIVKTYNVMIKNYNSTIKQLIDMLPEKESKTVKNELLEYLKGKK